MAIVVTRCLSPLGTGNDETGSFWTRSRRAILSALPVFAVALPCENQCVLRSSTAIGDGLNMPSGKIPSHVHQLNCDVGRGT
jgi:hypothetical protein